MKRRVNFTIERDVARQAKCVAAERGTSLSALAEGELKRLLENAHDLPRAQDGEHWLDRFHATYLPEGFIPSTDLQVKEIHKGMRGKHSPEKRRRR